MSTGSPLTVAAQMLCASGCAYSIQGTSYQPPPGDPFGPAIGWTASNPPTVITGGAFNEDAALVGTLTLAGTTTTAIVVAFEGTVPPSPGTWDSVSAWMQNLLAAPLSVSDLHGSVHRGIYSSVNNVHEAVLAQVAALQRANPQAPLYITGHSKGGGMASICAAMIYWLASDTLQPSAVYTFASPMIGLADFVASFPGQIPVSRYENTLDIVPFLAPGASFLATLKANEHLEPHITVILDAVVALLETFGGGGDWGYVPLGALSYIDGTTITTPSINPCAGAIASTLAQGTSGLSIVLDAHSHACGQGYMNGVCNGMGVCS